MIELSMDVVLAVGFGNVIVTKDREVIYQEMESEIYPRVAEVEESAKNDPNHHWMIRFYAPTWEGTYCRSINNGWVLTSTGPGFA